MLALCLSHLQRAELEMELECSVANDLPDRIGSLLEHGLHKVGSQPQRWGVASALHCQVDVLFTLGEMHS